YEILRLLKKPAPRRVDEICQRRVQMKNQTVRNRSRTLWHRPLRQNQTAIDYTDGYRIVPGAGLRVRYAFALPPLARGANQNADKCVGRRQWDRDAARGNPGRKRAYAGADHVPAKTYPALVTNNESRR